MKLSQRQLRQLIIEAEIDGPNPWDIDADLKDDARRQEEWKVALDAREELMDQLEELSKQKYRELVHSGKISEETWDYILSDGWHNGNGSDIAREVVDRLSAGRWLGPQE